MAAARNTRRFAALLAGAMLTMAGVSAGGSPVMASPGTRHADVRAEVLALLEHHGMNNWRAGGGAPDAPAAAMRGLRTAIPMPGTQSALNGVFCTSKTNCLAVGSFHSATSGATLNQVLHFNGTKWSRDITVPSQGGTTAGAFSELNAVRCRAATDCWAVGDYHRGGATLNQALHFNGTKWSVKATPTPGGTLTDDANGLFDIVCPAASTCWAAGEYGNFRAGTAVVLNELLRWNGTTWSLASSVPQPAGTSFLAFQTLNGIRCTSATSCLAVGSSGSLETFALNEVLQWNGTKWSTLTVPNPGGTATDDINVLTSLACTSATDCWAAGQYGFVADVQTAFDQLLHWNGTAWTQDTAVRSPDGPGEGSFSELNAITCSSDTNCWAVGDSGSFRNGAGEIVNQTQHWNGTKWSLIIPPNPGGIAAGSFNSLKSARCTSITDCWAVGSVMNPSINQALHWNGTAWSVR